MQHHTK